MFCGHCVKHGKTINASKSLANFENCKIHDSGDKYLKKKKNKKNRFSLYLKKKIK